ncbi:Uncharacterized protein Rs2_40599 [Raphanus sativus]|nr:Uncharacterized protein Rs2_40599 [Raphanus sativus]
MSPSNLSMSRLEDLPDDMLRLIVSKVGSASSTDYFNAISSCNSMTFGVTDPMITKTLNITPLVKRPDRATSYTEFMASLIAANKFDAHFVKGMSEYFSFNNRFLGLHHLRFASKGNHKETKYLYGLLLMALGMIDKGKKILSKLTNDVGLASVEMIWESIQSSLSYLPVELKDEYVASYMSMQPEVDCHPEEINTVCSNYYHAFLMSEFSDMVIDVNPAHAAASYRLEGWFRTVHELHVPG